MSASIFLVFSQAYAFRAHALHEICCLSQLSTTLCMWMDLLASCMVVLSTSFCLSLMQDVEVQVKIRFDAAEACTELQRLGLVTSSDHGFSPCSAKEALIVLKDHWDDLLLDVKHAAVAKA